MLEGRKKSRALSLLINVDDAISLDTGKTVVLNTDVGQEGEIDQVLNQVLPRVTEESKYNMMLGKKERAEEDLLHPRVSHLARAQALNQRGRNLCIQPR